MTSTIAAAIKYGWPLIRLSAPDSTQPSPGKKPLDKNWETAPGLTAEQATAHLATNGNLGIRCGDGLLVVDCDGDVPPGLPETLAVQTGGGGTHFYYHVPDGVTFRHTGNTAKWIHPTTDTRYSRGQVVAPGSIHAETGALYEWMPGCSPDDTQIADCPQWVIDGINNTEKPPWSAKPVAPSTTAAAARDIATGLNSAWIAAALRSAVANVASAPEGERNVVLNREAFSLAGYHEISEAQLYDAFLGAATIPENEARRTLASAIPKGREKPRTVPTDAPRTATDTPPPGVTISGSPADAAMPPGYIAGPWPRLLAEKYLAEHHPGGTLRHWRGDWYRYTGTHYAVYTATELHRDLSRIMAPWHFFTKRGETAESVTSKITDGLLRDVVSQIRGLVLIPDRREAPCWLDGVERPPAREWLALQNGLLSLAVNRDTDPPTRAFIAHTPALFNTFALPFAFDADADSPETWIDFLSRTWPGEPGADCALMLAEWFGYCLSRDMSHHKMLWIIGPTRSGKGVVSRILAAVLGPENACYPTLGSLGDKNGGQVLIGQRLAIIGDARLDKRRADKASIIERLLSISGGDEQTFARKYLPDWTGTPECKFVMLSNELPPLADESGALLGRLLFLQTTESHLGREDRFLESRIRRELPGILNWALDGLERLNTQGRFASPESSREIIATFRAISAPLTAFVEDCCVVGEDATIECGALYCVYQKWAEDEGLSHPYSKHVFGQKLKAVVPGLRRERVRGWDSRAYYYHGVGT